MYIPTIILVFYRIISHRGDDDDGDGKEAYIAYIANIIVIHLPGCTIIFDELEVCVFETKNMFLYRSKQLCVL